MSHSQEINIEKPFSKTKRKRERDKDKEKDKEKVLKNLEKFLNV